MTVRVKFWCESPWAGCDLEDEFDFEDDATDEQIAAEYNDWIHENFGGGYEVVKGADDE